MRGVYAHSEPWRALAPWQRYLARVHAAALCYPDAIFVLESAAALRGMSVFGEPRFVSILLPRSTTSRPFDGVHLRTRQRMPAVERLGGFQVATAAETAVEIARLRHHAVGLATADSALRADERMDAVELLELSRRMPSSRGRRHAEWVFERATRVRESPLESVSSAVIEWLGFEPPELQKWVRGELPGEDDRLDFWWPAHRIGGEADGELKYNGANGDSRAALRARNARDARLMSRGVFATAHWAWTDVESPNQIKAILRAVGLPIVRPPQTAELATLPAALHSGSA